MPSIQTVLTIVIFIALWLSVQTYLSFRNSKYPGLALPILCFVGDIIFTSFASNITSALLAFAIGFIPCGVMIAVYVLCRMYMGKQKEKSVEHIEK